MEKIPESTYACTQCGANFTSHETFQQHVLQHNEPYAMDVSYLCNKCGAVFTTQSALQEHECDVLVYDSSNYQYRKSRHAVKMMLDR